MSTVKPFLKWAGGKRWLVDSGQLPTLPEFRTYFEPFLGSASIFFALQPRRAVLSDLNGDLVNCYNAIRSEYKLVWRYLLQHRRSHSDYHYYKTRQNASRSSAARAADFIYLNRTCWNGLYRVNKRGSFNVPRGTKDSVIFEDDNFGQTSKRLEETTIQCCDFESTIAMAGKGDFIFADPPYTVLHNYNGFVKYNEKIFSWADQLRLRNALIAASARGAVVVMTNADHESVRDLYKEVAHLSTLHRHSKLSGSAEGRRPTTELLVTFLPTPIDPPSVPFQFPEWCSP